MMKYQALGQTGLEVSRICFGTWSYGGDWGSPDVEGGIAAVRSAHEAGITFFDTARAYGFGISERVLAQALDTGNPARRGEVVIATKGGLRDAGTQHVRDSRPEELRHGLEQSLVALDTDYVDVFLIHWPDPSVPPAEVAGVLAAFVKEGKVRAAGVSNFDASQLSQVNETGIVSVFQPPLHLFRRQALELLPMWAADGIGVFSYAALAHGLLTTRFSENRTFPADDWRAKSSIFRGEAFAVNQPIVANLAAFATERGTTISQLAIAWVLAQPGLDAAIVGARTGAQLAELVGAADLELDAADLNRIDELTADYVEVGGASPGQVW
jgi:aryl-alcohol dehydrogenase-like predicted oxidoreductase